MKKILVVDDVPVIVQSIKKMLEEKYTFEVLESNNGEDALTKLETYNPDVLITDVRMPHKDGIELIQDIRKKGLDIPIVVISGFKEFEYVEKALNMGVVGYIVKPISKNQLYDAMDKVIDLIKENRWKGQLTSEIKHLKKQKINELKESQIYNLLLSKDIDKDMKTYDLTEEGYYVLYSIKLSEDIPEQLGFTKKDKELIENSLKNIILEKLGDYQAVYMRHKEVECCKIILLQNEKELVLKYNTVKLAEELHESVKRLLGIEVKIGISTVRKNLEKELYNEAQIALQATLFNTDIKVQSYECYAKNIKTNKSIDTLMDLLEMNIKNGEYKKIKDILDKIFCEKNEYISSIQQLKYTLSCIYTFIYESLEKEAKKAIEVDFLEDNYLLQVKCLEEIKEEILKQLRQIFFSKGINLEEDYKNNIVESVHNYIEQNISQNISIRDLANLCGMHYNYFSSLFKKLTDKSTVQYITDIKMKKAIELLEEGNEVISEIALMVGYTDIQYFYKTFKKYTGKTPLAYRNKK